MNSAEGLAFGGKQNEEIKHASAKNPLTVFRLDLLNFWCVGEVKVMAFIPGSEDRAKRVHPTALEHTSAKDRLQGPVPLPSPSHPAGALLILV